MPLSLPPNPSFEQLRKQAKDLLSLHQQDQADCCSVLRQLRQFAEMSDAEILKAEIALNDVQFALALYYGYDGWTDLKRYLESRQTETIVPKLEKKDRRACIHGFEQMDWGGSFFRRQDSQVAYLEAVLCCAGQKASYADIMGLSACAFKLTMGSQWPPHRIHSEFGLD